MVALGLGLPALGVFPPAEGFPLPLGPLRVPWGSFLSGASVLRAADEGLGSCRFWGCLALVLVGGFVLAGV